jgi:hypothetical protein
MFTTSAGMLVTGDHEQMKEEISSPGSIKCGEFVLLLRIYTTCKAQ